MAVRPRRGEGRLHNYNYWQYLGGKLGQFFFGGGGGGGGGEVELFGGEASPAPPSLDAILSGSNVKFDFWENIRKVFFMMAVDHRSSCEVVTWLVANYMTV